MIKALLKSKLASFSKQEKIIAEYLMDLNEDPSLLTSSSISNALGISQSTVIRFTQKLGYSSFRTFLIDLSRVYTSDLKVKERSVNATGTIQKMVERYEESIHGTHTMNYESTLTEVCNKIRSADRVVVYGSSNSSIFAEYLANQLNKTGVFVQFAKGFHATMVSASQLTRTGVAIVLSQSGETQATVDVAKYCRNHDVPVISITGKHRNTLQRYSDLILYSSDYSKDEINIRISQLFLVDVLIQELNERK